MDTNAGGIQPVHVWYTLVVSATGVAAFLWRIGDRLKRVVTVLEKFMMEHEILIGDYCKRNGIEPQDLPTRTAGLLYKK